MFNSEWLRNEYNNKNLIVVVSNKPRRNGHEAHLLRKDLRSGDYYEISKKTGKEIKNYYCWWQIEDWIKDGSYRLIDLKNGKLNDFSWFWKDWFFTELIEAVREVE